MSPYQRERELFEACLELSEAERSSYLRNMCRNEPELERRISSLLSAHESLFLEQPPHFEKEQFFSEAVPGGFVKTADQEVERTYCVKCQKTVPDASAGVCGTCGQQRPARGWPVDPLLGRTVAGGQYRVLCRLGSGGFGVVYEIATVVGGLRRALKVLREDWAQDQSIRERFINEAVTLERINHPNVARCFAAGTLDENGELYLLFELIDGVPLSELVGGSAGEPIRRLDPLRAVRIARQVASGLVAAHAKHVLHRDLKPANVMVTEAGTPSERIKLLDFGIAKFLEGEMTWTAGLIGTPDFMAPEQFAARSEVGSAVDLWQLGALMHTMLTGRPPYQPKERSLQSFLSMHRPPGSLGPLPSEVDPSLAAHPALNTLVGQLLSTNPADRPASAADLCQELAGIEQALSPGASSSRSALLDALCAKPSADSWLALCRYLESQDEEVREAAEQRLSGWPLELRRAPCSWWERARRGETHPLWRLVRTLDLAGRGISDEEITKIVACGALVSLRRLILADNAIGPEGAQALAGSRFLERLEWLDLSGNRIGSQGLEFLAKSPNLKRLCVLKLAGNRIGARALESMVGSGLPLEHLDLADNDFGAGGAEILARADLGKLRTLVLRNNRLGADGVAVFSVSPLFAGLQHLDLSQNGIGPAGVAVLALSRKLTEMRHLVLSQNSIGREGLQLLLSSAGLESVEALDISSNGVGANGAMALASSLLARRIRVLNLANNEIGDTGLAALLGAPQLTGLSSLDISQNELTPSGIALLDGAAIQLQSLDLSTNPIGQKGAEVLDATIGHLRLRHLKIRRTGVTVEDLGRIVQGGKGNLIQVDASDNRLEAGASQTLSRIPELMSLRSLRLNGIGAGREELAAIFSSPYLTNLEELYLNSNSLGDEGLVELAAISGLSRLSKLSLQDNGIGYQGAAALATSPLAAHLTHLDLSFNQLSDTGAEAVASGSSWHQLQELHLRANGIGFGGAAALFTGKALGMLQVVDLADNPLLGELDVYGLDNDRLALVESSFGRISEMGKRFAESFYDRLFHRFPEVKPLFSHVSMSRQQQHLITAVVMIIENLRSPDTLSTSLTSLSQRHVGYGVRPGHYTAFSTVFLEVLEEALGEEWSADLQEAWTEALEAITRVMLNAHRETKAGP
jgi:serine/threonine protein kinase/hemoglobin-like flavoprotein/Ran GTPase-activating protein (RanGAP) involved in mRNA processing and transport